MNMKVSDIFREKLASIQSRVPVKISTNQNAVSFEELLNNELSSISEKNGQASNQKPVYNFTTANNALIMNRINQAVETAAQKYNLNPNLIKSVIKAESSFNPYARSNAGAEGLMQLMPSTARALGVSNSFDINQNIDGGAKYLREKLDQFNGNISLALAAYNAGPNAVIRYNGIPPYTETQNYVKKVLSYLEDYNKSGG